MRKALFAALVAGIVLVASGSVAGAAGAGGVTGPSFYVDGTLYRTVGTPTDLSGTGAPAAPSRWVPRDPEGTLVRRPRHGF